MASVVQNGLDLIFSKDEIILRIISKVLFSLVPLLILSKLLYVMKIRHFGNGEYSKVFWRFLLYNFYYFVLVLLAASLYLLPAIFASSIMTMRTGFLMTSFLLIPLIYIMLYYSLSPFVAVFDDEGGSIFSKSKIISSSNIFLVIINHLCSLLIPGLFSSIILINNSLLKFSLALLISVPEAIFSILMILTTSRIYLYLIEKE
ncbi:MAG: hypothetical protein PHY93_11770 [Bacteriovorax sp.]|nr:hypothetical protein [Bacteriovorax sp.]